MDVLRYGSKKYYVITAAADGTEKMQTFPITGKETVLDAIGQLQGVRVSSKVMWVARPTPGCMNAEEVFPVDYEAIARGGQTDTNYQLLPGDRVYIVDEKLLPRTTTLPRSRLRSSDC